MNIDDPVSASELAEIFGVTGQSVARLARDGIIPRVGRGRYPLRASLQGYMKHRLDSEVKRTATTGAADRLREARAAEIQQRIARQDRTLITMDEALWSVDNMSGIFLTEFTQLPARITRDPRERRRIESLCDDARTRICKRLEEIIAATKTGVGIEDEDED